MGEKSNQHAGGLQAPRARRSRSEILVDVGDIDSLPFPAIDTIDPLKRNRYAARSAAVRLWCGGAKQKQIQVETGLTALSARRLVEKAIEKDPVTGQRAGLFVCIPGYRSPKRKKPCRKKEFDPMLTEQGRGRSGVMARCLARYPEIEADMVQFTATRRIGNSPPVALIDRKTFIQAFHFLCQNHGLRERNEWPFDAKRRGENAIWSWYLRRKWDHSVKSVRNELGDDAGKLAQRDFRSAARDVSRPDGPAFDRLEMDEHLFHSMFGLLAPAPGGGFLPCGARRPWVLALVDRGTWTCVASALSTRTRYDTNDVKRLLVRSLLPPPLYTLSIQNKNFRYRDDAAYPAEVIGPRLWRELAVDFDASHVSAESLEIAEKVLRCNVVSERIGDPTARSFIEGYFSEMASFMESLPSSTGSNPRAAAWRNPEAAAIRYHLALPLAEEILDVYSRNWNVLAKASCGGVSPLVLLQDKLARQQAFHKPLDAATRGHLWKLLPRFEATITRQRGETGPFRINFSGRYGSPELSDHPELRYLKDRRVYLYIQEDARFAHAVPFSRPDLVFHVTLLGQFRTLPHTIELRKMCLAARTNMACTGRADSPRLIMGVLQGLGEAAQTSDGSAAVLAGTVNFMNRYGLGNEHYICLPAEVRDRLQDYACRVEIDCDDDASTTFDTAEKSTSVFIAQDLFGKL